MDFTWKIGGEAGYGIMSAGAVFSKACKKAGYFTFAYNEYPSLIRGGHNVFIIRVSSKPVLAPRKPVDVLVALNKETFDLHYKEMKNGYIVVNTDKVAEKDLKGKGSFQVVPVPLITLAKEAGGSQIMMNNVALGASFALVCAPFAPLREAIKSVFSKLDEETLAANVKAAKAGYDYVKKDFAKFKCHVEMAERKKEDTLVLSGNEGICLGAVKAGCKFLSAYPMTPINSIWTYFAKRGPKLGFLYVQPEDEITAVSMAIGASFSGVRAMTCSSGGGYSLMVESYGLAGMTETPLVIVEGQRPGPATGLPTWTGQGDLRFVLHAAQDEFPRIVLAPGDPEECFFLTAEAFNLAERYQAPVVLLTDKHLLESYWTWKRMDESKVKIDRGKLMTEAEQKKPYQRYEVTKDGISPRPIPGRKGETFIVNSDEHNEEGYSEESSENRITQMEKRMRKMDTLAKKLPRPKVHGPKKADLTFVSWGSPKGAILEAQEELRKEGVKTNFLQLTHLNPFPERAVKKILSDAERIVMVEQNYSAQGAGLVREKTGIDIPHKLTKYDGRPFYVEEIIDYAKGVVKQ